MSFLLWIRNVPATVLTGIASRPPGILAVLAAAAFIALSELDRLVGETRSIEGQTATLSEVVGPLAAANTDRWSVWASAVVSPMPLVLIHVVLDVVFFLCYLGLLWRVDTAPSWRGAVSLLFAAEVGEDLVLIIESATHTETNLMPADVLVAIFATAKWLLVLYLIIRVFGSAIWPRVKEHARTGLALLGVHRVGLGILAVLAAVSLVPQSGVVEQLPDVQRAWITWDRKTGGAGDGVGVDFAPIAGAIVVAVVLVLGLFAIGRVRSRMFARLVGTARTEPDFWTYFFWFCAPAIALAVFTVLYYWNGFLGEHLEFVDWVPLLIFVVVTVAVPLVSLFWDRRSARADDDFPFRVDPRAVNLPPATTVPQATEAGERIAAVALTVIGLGMIRSFTAPMLLGIGEYAKFGSDSLGIALLSSLFAVIGLGLAIVGVTGLIPSFFAATAPATVNALSAPSAPAPPALAPLPAATPRPTPLPPEPGELRLRWVLGLGSLAVLAAVALAPLQLTQFGALFTAVGILLAWGLLITVVESRLQEHRPLRVFGSLGMQSAPLLALFVGIPFVVAQLGGPAALHAMQSGTAVATSVEHPTATIVYNERPTLAEAFRDWEARQNCTVVTSDGVEYRPMLLVAAQGGGIRAATWTTDVLSELDAWGECGNRAAFLASGASGGSVGLTMLRGGIADGDDGVSTDTISDQRALSAGLAGVLITDAFAATTGLRVPSLPGYAAPDGRSVWQDRAALIQASWAAQSGRFAEPYDFEYQGETGWLILNSTAAGANCRAVVSQIDLEIGTGGADDEDPAATCISDTPSVSGLIDLQAYCDLKMDWATAAMFSSRFPVVTPAGRISGIADTTPSCKTLENLQLADGGYAENSGLGTLSDLAPDITNMIAIHNAHRSEGAAPVIPFLLFIRNEGGADLTAPPVKATSDLIVPFLALDTKNALISDVAWLQRLSDDLSNVCTASEEVPDDGCTGAVAASREIIAGGVAVAAPQTEPAIISPLGWTLSDISREQLEYEAARQTSRTCDDQPDTSFGRLGDLLNALHRSPEGCKDTD